jgi:DNA-binding MarR family transcriptional regulator
VARLPDSSEPLVEAIATRLRRVDLIAWGRIAAWAEQHELSFEDLRLLLALRITDGPSGVSDVAGTSGLPLEVASPAINALHGRGYLHEERRRYSLSNDGRELVAMLDAAHREGIQAYVDQLDPGERQMLEEAFGITR